MQRRWMTSVLLSLIILVALFVLVLQAYILPLMAGMMAFDAPELVHLKRPLLTVAIAGLTLFQIVLFCAARLVLIAGKGQVFQPTTFFWTRIIVITSIVAGFTALVLLFVLPALGAGQPGVSLMLIICVIVAAGVALLVSVLQRLLAEAIGYRKSSLESQAELAEVI